MRSASLIAGLTAAGLFLLPATAQEPDKTDPNTCKELWVGIGVPDRKETDDENFTIVCHLGYIVGHNNDMKTPDWVVEHLTFKQVSGTATRKGASFKSEPEVPAAARAQTKDYAKSKFDQGHQAPAADFKGSKEQLFDTFFLSNSVPQVGIGFNRHIWQELEEHIQTLVKTTRQDLYVITGPVYQKSKAQTVKKTADACRNEVTIPVLEKKSICPENRDDPRIKCEAGVAIPAALYKIIYDPESGRVNAFLLPNVDHTEERRDRRSLDYLNKFRVGVDTVESLTGVKFFTAMSKREQRKLRENCPPTIFR